MLVLRCAAIGLLALGFARPFVENASFAEPAGAPRKRTLILIDASASMRREGLWAAARERVAQMLRRSGPEDSVALYVFDRETRPLVSFEEWQRTPGAARVETALSRLAALAPGWGGTKLGAALIAAAEMLAETERGDRDAARPAAPREVVVVSDWQAGGRLEALQAYEWPKEVAVRIEWVSAKRPTNAGVQLVAEAANSARALDAAVRVRVTNAAESTREQFQLGWAGEGALDFAAAPLDAYVPPGQSRVVSLPLPAGARGAQRVRLTGDDETFDNLVYVVPPARRHANVVWLGAVAEDPGEPLFFLRRAFSDSPRLAVRFSAHAPAGALPRGELDAANLIFIAAALPPEARATVRAQIESGKTAIVLARSPDMTETLRDLTGGAGVSLTDAKPARYAMLAEIDFRHPLFAAFADPRFSDFTKIHVWKYRRLDPAALPGARTVASFDNGDPAIVELAAGTGRIFILTTGWQPDDSQLAVSSKFVPLMWSFLEFGGALTPVPTQFVLGDELPGNLAAAEPGIFAGPRGAASFAVNLDPSESRTDPLDVEEVHDFGLPVPNATASRTPGEANEKALQATEAESRQKLWRWFLAATLAVLLIETTVAGWTARRARARTEAVS